jgi:uncharacterized protein (TIGR02246 family)
MNHTIENTENEDILRGVLDHWKAAVDAHDPQRAASYFTEDAIFQGLHPYSVGREGIAEYYGSLPIGMTATYKTLETRRLADDLMLGYLSVEFSFADRPSLRVYLAVLVTRTAEGWSISHYQVSQLDESSSPPCATGAYRRATAGQDEQAADQPD